MSVPPGQSAQQAPTCVRHPDRVTGLTCSRCGRPSCPECLHEASVGYHCVDCVAEGRRTMRRPTTVAGAPLHTKPLITPILIALNVAVFGFTAYQAGSVSSISNSLLFDQWAFWTPAVDAGQWWRIVTSGFLHFGLVHIAMNMIALWIIGRDMEVLLGRARYVVVYLVSLLGGSASVFLFSSPRGVVAGASGAVFGLMAGIVIACYRLKLNPRTALIVIAVNVVFSLTVPGISWQGHFGGMLAGALVTIGMLYAPARQRLLVQASTVIAVLAVLAALFVIREATFGPSSCVEQPTTQRTACHWPGMSR